MSQFKTPFKGVLALALSVLITFSSCRKSDDQIGESTIADENFVSSASAKEIAVRFIKTKISDSQTSNAGKTVEMTKDVMGNNGKTAFYIINYKEGGFALVSADRRTPKVIGFSESGRFDENAIQPGLAEWISTTKEQIAELRQKNIAYSNQDKRDIFKVMDHTPPSSGIHVNNVPPPPPCEDHSEMVNALITTNWGQGAGYNNTMPLLACGPNGHAYTGCVPTAMAQIIRYHQFPTNYNYSIMPTTVYYPTGTGVSEIANLMKAASVSVNVTYDCDGTGAYSSAIAGAFINTFGYGLTTRLIDYAGTANYITVQNELRAHRPVLFTGQPSKSTSGHAWVCDGFAESTFCDTGNTLLTLHMNWGWDGSNNGWYSFGNFNPGSTSYNYGTKVVVGITPGSLAM